MLRLYPNIQKQFLNIRLIEGPSYIFFNYTSHNQKKHRFVYSIKQLGCDEIANIMDGSIVDE